MVPDAFQCYLVKKTGKGRIDAAVERRPGFELPPGEVLIRVAYSSLNYKDALAATGHPGVARSFPHVPGVDAAGVVVESDSPEFAPGDEVVTTGYELGVERWGGWSQYVRVPAEWVIRLGEGLSLEESMILGTAGVAAGLAVRSLQHHGVSPDAGQVVVTGATGGVGSLAVRLLAQLGYHVVAVSGKQEKHAWLEQLGAARVVGRGEFADDPRRPLQSARFAGGIDTVGDGMLAGLLSRIQNEGCVVSCGLVGGAELRTTVYPFILRGVTLAGIDSAWCSRSRRQDIWDRLAGPWRLEGLCSMGARIPLEGVADYVARILAGELTGRVVIELPSERGV